MEKIGKRSFLKALAALVPGVALLSRAKPAVAVPALADVHRIDVPADVALDTDAINESAITWDDAPWESRKLLHEEPAAITHERAADMWRRVDEHWQRGLDAPRTHAGKISLLELGSANAGIVSFGDATTVIFRRNGDKW